MSERADAGERAPGEGGTIRFEATVHPRAEGADLEHIADFDVDRVPDPEGRVRLLVDLEECRRLLDGGFEVRLQRAVPVRPLDVRLVATEDDVRAWFDERVREAGRNEGE